MGIVGTEVLKANAVVVGAPEADALVALESLRALLGTDVVVSGALVVVGASSGGGHVLTVARDRLEISLAPARTVIEREYPSGADDLAAIANAYGAVFGDLLEQEIKSFGVNVELTYEQDSSPTAFHYLGSRLLETAVIEKATGRRLVGGSGKLVLDAPDDDERWTLMFEPRFGAYDTNRCFATLNIHKAQVQAPTPPELRALLTRAYDDLLTIVEQVDTSGGAA